MLFSEIVYGPIHSRRLGRSLGMELMPLEHKLCTFDCVYCECGFNQPVSHPVLPTREEVYEALKEKLEDLQKAGEGIDVITFSGNGEPTLHPDFLGIIRDTCALRDMYSPNAKVSVLSNSTQLERADVVEALRLCDNRILKLDSAIDSTMQAIDQPLNKDLTVRKIIDMLSTFNGDFTLQTCFLRGVHDGVAIDNTTPEEVAAWYNAVNELKPRQIMMYVIDRATPVKTLEKVPRAELEHIAAPLQNNGYDIIISA